MNVWDLPLRYYDHAAKKEFLLQVVIDHLRVFEGGRHIPLVVFKESLPIKSHPKAVHDIRTELGIWVMAQFCLPYFCV